MNAPLFLLMVVGSIWCAVVASGKNRSLIGWMIIGGLVPVIGMVAILCLPAVTTPEESAPST